MSPLKKSLNSQIFKVLLYRAFPESPSSDLATSQVRELNGLQLIMYSQVNPISVCPKAYIFKRDNFKGKNTKLRYKMRHRSLEANKMS